VDHAHAFADRVTKSHIECLDSRCLLQVIVEDVV
jgi:hypothetical protein